jgi:hypothetical protein
MWFEELDYLWNGQQLFCGWLEQKKAARQSDAELLPSMPPQPSGWMAGP